MGVWRGDSTQIGSVLERTLNAEGLCKPVGARSPRIVVKSEG